MKPDPFAVALLLAATGLLGSRGHAQAPVPVPQGLSSSDWTSLRAVHESRRRAAFAVDGGYEARDPLQQWLVRFDGRGVSIQPDGQAWSWGLQLESFGFAGRARLAEGRPDVTAEGQRVTYDWHGGLREWFINDAQGLEHGYTIDRRPEGGEGPLNIELAVRGNLAPAACQGARGASFHDDEGRTLLHYAGLSVFDADGRAVAARLDVLPGRLRISIDEQEARYPLTVDPVVRQPYLKASNTGVGDEFGYSVAVFGDTVVVGARLEDSAASGVNGNESDNSGTDSGAAYVFVREGGSWSQQAYLKASNPGGADQFGRSVAISRNLIAVGALHEDSGITGVNGHQHDNSVPSSGAVYLFHRSGTSWRQQAYVKSSNPDTADEFGCAVDCDDNTLVVGAFGEASKATGVNGDQSDDSMDNAGAVYVFTRSGLDWSQQAYIKASNTDMSDNFGGSVSIDGDTLIVGAMAEDSNATGINGDDTDNSAFFAGAAYVFTRSGGTWSQQAYLKGSDTTASDAFGTSVAVSGDTAIVGAPEAGTPATGAAYVFTRSGSTWTQQQKLLASNSEPDDHFGRVVDVCDEVAIVSACCEDSSATGINGDDGDEGQPDSGALYVFARSLGAWAQTAYVKATNTESGDNFGMAASLSNATIIAGSNYEASDAKGVNGDDTDNSMNSAGAAYVVELP